jgi:hypothetical protein
MAYPVSPETPPRVRPSVVTAAVYLLYLAAALEVVSAITAFLGYGPMKTAYEQALADTTAAGQAGTFALFILGAGILALIIAVVLVVLAIVDGRGSNVGRIITWVFGAITLCCSGGSLALGQVGNSMSSSSNANGGADAQKIQDAITAALPSWYKPVTTVAGILFLLALLGALILLALPAANAFFSKRAQEVWEPPLPPSAPQPPSGPLPPSGPQAPTV